MGYYLSGPHTVYPPDTVFFITITVIDWVDVFTREEYKKIIVESLDFCCRNKGLQLHAWVLMTNHIHLIASHETDSDHLWQVIRDFKKFTSKKIIASIIGNPVESRKKWMVGHFLEENIANNDDASCSVSKKGISPADLNHTVYDCANCSAYPRDCKICIAEMRDERRKETERSDTRHYHLWQRGFDRYCIYNIKHMRQKIDYLHENPVRAGFVSKPWEYRYSSYPNYCGEEGLIDIDCVDLGLIDSTKSRHW